MVRADVRGDVNMRGKGSNLFIIEFPILSGTCVLRGLAGVCGVLVCGLRMASPGVFRMTNP